MQSATDMLRTRNQNDVGILTTQCLNGSQIKMNATSLMLTCLKHDDTLSITVCEQHI